jgi:hypothetical protein
MYNCHSAARRAQFSIREGGIREFEGREAKRKIMQRASSISRTASMKVGYLAKGQNMTKAEMRSMLPTFP